MPRKKRLKKTWLKLRRKLNRKHAKRKLPRAAARLRPSKALARRLNRLMSSATGKSLLRRTRKFWNVPFPPAVSYLTGEKERALRSLGIRGLMSMGRSDRVVIRAAKKKRAPTKILRGKWKPYADVSGRRILMLSGKAIKLPFVKVGVAPETWYFPTKAMEALGTDKARTMWRHLHTDDGGKPPDLYADRGGKIDRNSNFVYGRGTYSVTDWIRR